MRPSPRTRWLALPLMLALAGCASDPVPDIAYFGLLGSAPASARAEPAFKLPVSVDAYLADGVYNEQAMLYQEQDAGGMRAYHYQLWQDPPTRLLQRHLIEALRARNVSALVSDRLPPSAPQLHVSGRIDQFVRVKEADGWHARVKLELRVVRDATRAPLLVKGYSADVLAVDNSMSSTIRAFSNAVDKVYGEFIVDLERVTP